MWARSQGNDPTDRLDLITGPMRPIRVLQLGSPTGLYGAERWILALIGHLPRPQIECWVGSIKDSPDLAVPLCGAAAQAGFRTHVFESYGRLSRSAIKQIREFILANEIDILHTHGYKTDIIGVLAVRGTGCKIVATPHGWGASHGLRLKLYEKLDRVALRFFDTVVPLSREMFEGLQFLKRTSTKLRLIENGVDLAEIDLNRSIASDLISVKARGATIIGYVGRLERGKRLDTLIRALHRLPVQDKYLCIVGEGPERAALEALARSLLDAHQYQFMGFRGDRIEIVRGFDVFVLPSGSEGVPRCLMEAMAVGVASIATDIPGCRELVIEGKTGLLFPVGSETKLVTQLQKLVDCPDRRVRIARTGEAHVRTQFSARLMAGRYKEVYEGLVVQAAGGPSIGRQG